MMDMKQASVWHTDLAYWIYRSNATKTEKWESMLDNWNSSSVSLGNLDTDSFHLNQKYSNVYTTFRIFSITGTQSKK